MVSVQPAIANNQKLSDFHSLETPEDSARLVELDRYWTKLPQAVQEGDYEGYMALYHGDAAALFGSGENKISVPIAKAS